MIKISWINESLVELCEEQFSRIGWIKPEGYFRRQLERQEQGELICFVAHVGETYVGHTRLIWQPGYEHFRDNGIPEISDLNVLPDYRKHGIGTSLIKRCEEATLKRSDTIGIAVGLHPGYCQAQRLYSKLGYILDGQGVYYGYRPVEEGEVVTFNDMLVMNFTKKLM